MALDTVTSSNLYTSDSTYQYTTRVVPDTEERTLMISLINFLQKHHLDETQAALLRELSLTENSEVTLDELQHAINKRDNKLMSGARTQSHGHLSPLPMDTEENYRKLQTAHPPVQLTNEKSHAPIYNEISMSPAIQHSSPPRFIPDDSPIIIPKVETVSSSNDPISILVQTPNSSAPVSSPSQAPYQVPIILNNFSASNQSNNILTLLQPSQNVSSANPAQQQTHILLDVGSNSLSQLQHLGAKSLNGVIPIQLNLSPSQPLQQTEQQQQRKQQQQQHLAQQQQQILNTSRVQSQPIILTSLGNAVANCSSKLVSPVTDTSNHIQTNPSLAIHVQHPTSSQPNPTPLLIHSRIEQDPQLIHKEGTQINLDANRRPILSYTQVPSTITQNTKAIFTSNGICQVENVSSGDLHAIPIAAISPQFSFDPAFELGQRRRKKRAVFAPQVRRTLEISFEQNTRPSRRELEYLAAKLGLLFEEVRVWFCNKRQKERQQMQQLANDQSQGDLCGDSFNSFVDGSPPAVTGTQHSDDSLHEQDFHVKDEFESDNILLVPNEMLSESSDSEFKHHSLGPTINSIVQNSIA